MSKRIIKLVAAIAGAAIVAAVSTALAQPIRIAAAQWLPWRSERIVAGKAAANSADTTATIVLEQEIAIPIEAVITGKDGQSRTVAIVEPATAAKPSAATTTPVKPQSADMSQQSRLFDPVQAVKYYAANYGFSAADDTFTLVSQIYKGQTSGTGEASVLVQHGSRFYLVGLTQPEGSGYDRIWQIQSVREVRAVTQAAASQADVGPGVEGIDHAKAIKWQQAVDAGREMWRLDPLEVARREGKEYGFTAEDQYTVVKKLNSSSIARHGEIHVQVGHQGKLYTVILVRPYGSDSGAIWTIYKVTGAEKQPPTKEKVLFRTDKYADWKWHKGSYPDDMAFAAIVDYRAQLKYDKRIPEPVLAKIKDIDYQNKAVLFAYLGTAPSGGYGIGIEKVTMAGNNMTVQVRTRSPKPGDMVTMMISYPSDYVLIDRNILDIWGGVNVTFVNQDGKVLGKNKLVITHR